MQERGALAVRDAPCVVERVSLDTSLRELRTDYLDVLLLHSYQPGAPIEAVVEWTARG